MARSVPKKYWKAAKIKNLAEVFVGLRPAEVNLVEVGVGAMIEYHTSAPPFLWQYSAMSLIIDWKDCVWQ